MFLIILFLILIVLEIINLIVDKKICKQITSNEDSLRVLGKRLEMVEIEVGILQPNPDYVESSED
ncbi:hypothetical protein LCGC14_1739960 [marine sediment metagenome]|uniref:Uncharacterized protein n=1 Tax=marine sediment metagenome TaxID=412755 RepID=A0A0F9JM89_9ZZZZ